ncbi:hypothetical protein HOT99_gp218 [Caulobacter phage CcrBL10]|uniref:Carrier domain-containing protein n=1 Tax=Caulobacter phage CcrBL10 TaxID=2283269 RepID=A0A385ECH8_9CAUD|nr:hypothetical protein HOT99_gp218 [Caulobacter phage CcrBL10]AXQ68399.1 hypothetical protein CcrBL10_gp195c [Caulobacter phage CcrBL10]
MVDTSTTWSEVQIAVYEFAHMMSESHIALDDYHKGLRLMEDLRFDSLDLVDLAMSLEEEFGIDLPEGFPDEHTTLGVTIDVTWAALEKQR